MLFKFLLLFLVLLSTYVFAGGEKKCSDSFQNTEEASSESYNSITQGPAKGPKRATPHLSSSRLLAILENPSSSVADRKEAVRQSFFLKEAQGIVVVLEKALDDVSVEVRITAIKVAVNMGEVGLDVLNKAFEDSSPEVQRELMKSVALMSDRFVNALTAQGLKITPKKN